MGGSRPGHLEGLKGGKNHEEKVTTPSRELWGHAPGISHIHSTLKLSSEVLFMDFLTVRI